MNTQVNRMPPTAPAWPYLQRAKEAVYRAAAELPERSLTRRPGGSTRWSWPSWWARSSCCWARCGVRPATTPACAVAQPL